MQRGSQKVLECWNTLAALAAETKIIRLGTSVTCIPFRHPTLLAKMAATVDQISGGRLELGLGAGYDVTEFDSYGIPFPSFSNRTRLLEEAISIIKALWTTDGKVSFDSTIYKVEKAHFEPKPIQKPHPPIWVAGRSSPVLRVAASLADGVNIVPYSGIAEKRRLSTLDELAEKVREFDAYCTAQGRSLDELGRLLYTGDGGVIIEQEGKPLTLKIRNLAAKIGISPEEFKERMTNLSILHGDGDEVASRIRGIKGAGFNFLLLQFHGWQYGEFADMESFAKQIAPRVFS